MNALLFTLYYVMRWAYDLPQYLFIAGILVITRKILKWVW